MTNDNDKEKETPSEISGVFGPPEIGREPTNVTGFRFAGTSGQAWSQQAKPVSLLGGALRDRIKGVVVDFDRYSVMQSGIGDVEAELAEIRKELAEKTTALGEAEKDIEKRKELEERYKRLLALHGVLTQVHPVAITKLLEKGDNYLKGWLDKETIGSEKAFVISIDIRRSTELMLKAREPELFVSFVTELCNGLRNIILDQFGIFDKFTGDGVLAFFPEFYTGEDAGYRAITAASKSHIFFEEIYKESRKCFKAVLKDIGLGIGIDYGTIHMVKPNNLITAVGEPVVYACRMGGADPGLTLLNQPAYEKIADEVSEYCKTEDTEIKIKEGRILAYSVKLVKEKEDVARPSWYPVDKSNEEMVD